VFCGQQWSEIVIELLAGAVAFVLSGSPDTAGEATSVSFCQLVEHPSEYENKRVSLTAQIASGFETFALVDAACPTDKRVTGLIWLDTKDDGVAKYYGGWSLSDFAQAVKAGDLDARAAVLDWKLPAPVASAMRPELDAVHLALGSKKPVRALVVGRFDFVDKGRLAYGRDGRLVFSAGFGHLNGFSRRIVIERIAVVTRKSH
jgi:hypothetical protein